MEKIFEETRISEVGFNDKGNKIKVRDEVAFLNEKKKISTGRLYMMRVNKKNKNINLCVVRSNSGNVTMVGPNIIPISNEEEIEVGKIVFFPNRLWFSRDFSQGKILSISKEYKSAIIESLEEEFIDHYDEIGRIVGSYRGPILLENIICCTHAKEAWEIQKKELNNKMKIKP